MSVTTQNNDTELKKLLSSPVKSSGGGDASPMHPPASPGGSIPPSSPRPSTSQNAPAALANPQSLMTPAIPAQSTKELLEPCLQNVVSTVNVDCPLKLNYINTRTRNSEYNPARFTGLVMRIRNPRATALMFGSGKIVCTGARCEEDSFLAMRKFARILEKLSFPVKFLNFKIQNMVATCDLKFPIKLEQLNQMHGQFSSYEPELYPGLVYRMISPRVVLLIFVNGKVILTGAKNRTELRDAMVNIYPILKSFKKQ